VSPARALGIKRQVKGGVVSTCMRVLAVDGGGIRGLIPLTVLEYVERRTGRPASQLFDLMVGVSTGAVIVLGLATRGLGGGPLYGAKDIARFYEQESHLIFRRRVLPFIRNLFEAKYSPDRLEQVLSHIFGEGRLSQTSGHVVIPAYDIERDEPYLFDSRRARLDPQNEDFLVRDVARAASAAPTYFPPVRLARTARDGYLALVDGGVFANNPALIGYVEAMSLRPAAQILLVSLGTGESFEPILLKDARGWGLAKWAQPILSIAFDGGGRMVHRQLEALLPEDRYFRFQAELPSGIALDRVQGDSTRRLRLHGERVVARERSRLERLCALLSS